MPRLPSFRLAAPRGAAVLVAAGMALWGADAAAQTAVYPDPLTPRLQSDPRNPPRFQQFTRPALAQLGPPANFTLPPGAGAGTTGFDSSNSRKKAKSKTTTRAATPANTRATAPGSPVPAPFSPYQKPVGAAAGAALAQAPGAPPVDIGPIRQRPKTRKAHTEPDDPYAPLGVHAGSFMFFPAVELIGGYDTNPARSSLAQGASLYTVAPELLMQSNWSRHELRGELRGSYTGYSPDATPTLSRPNLSGKVDGRVDVTRNTRIDLEGRLLVGTDNPGSPNIQAGLAKLPTFTTIGGTAGLGQQFNRLDISLKGDVDRTVYQQSVLTDGTTASNDDRNFDQYAGKLRGGYELSPGVKPYVEVDVDTRVHDLNADFFGYQRNSNGVTGLVGTTFKLTNILTGDVGVGYTKRSYEDPRLEPIAGMVGNASLIWTVDALTTVKFIGASAVAESTVPGVSGELSRDIGLQVDHSFRRWLIGTLKVGAGLDDYVGLNREDKRFSAAVGMTYKLNRSVQLKGEFQQYWLRSNVTSADYNASVFLLGLRLQR